MVGYAESTAADEVHAIANAVIQSGMLRTRAVGVATWRDGGTTTEVWTRAVGVATWSDGGTAMEVQRWRFGRVL